ncbi:hypothetical protein B484DRAFT_89170 [Ochromonadaceae sp. CCMP2298]|nr:hypothetical protein B484DRAFT_89170 [Ochromonadaceae sp. CCMP2298]|mmetsp:Transcript_23895/g.53711  ORF Transcript_23895/g.53711 Transcript_23895/m.53711 type:complete len:225 (-) Transcript_23895:57-731(-)
MLSLELLCLVVLQCTLAMAFVSPLLTKAYTHNRLMMSSDEILKFGSSMNIDIRLPTKDRSLVAQFLNDTEYIVESTWDKAKIKKLSANTYLLKFIAIPIPGVDIVTPEIEVKFENIEGVVVMKSGNWSLKGESGKILKDSGFMKSFDIQLSGRLEMSEPSDSNPLISTIGCVEYKVQGAKPKVFRRAPGILLDGTINFIQSRVADFVNRRFSAQMLAAFRAYGE